MLFVRRVRNKPTRSISPAVAPEERTFKSIPQSSGNQLGLFDISSGLLLLTDRGAASTEPSSGRNIEMGSAAITTPGPNSRFPACSYCWYWGDSAPESFRSGSMKEPLSNSGSGGIEPPGRSVGLDAGFWDWGIGLGSWDSDIAIGEIEGMGTVS